MTTTSYNQWPIGKLPKHLQRPEPEQIRELGYYWEDAREIVTIFENRVAKFAGAKYAVAVDCCTHALELSLRYQLKIGELVPGDVIAIPANTYVSAYWLIKQIGLCPYVTETPWAGLYLLAGSRVLDAAVRWCDKMYKYVEQMMPPEDLPPMMCLSFQIKKRIPIGRGGMVLTDDKAAADWIRLASYDGRDLSTPYDSPGHVKIAGFHYYMIPEDAARGLILMESVKEEGDSGGWQNYPDIRQMLNLKQ